MNPHRYAILDLLVSKLSKHALFYDWFYMYILFLYMFFTTGPMLAIPIYFPGRW